LITHKYQGRQIGRKLAVEAIKIAKSLGAKKIILETSNKLKKAVNLYKKLGFVDVNYNLNEKTQYMRPSIRMELTL
jgi:ribosomal protein S18 acetylase RimI-like enzyme